MSEQIHPDGVSPEVYTTPGVLIHLLQVVVDVALTVETEDIVNVDIEMGTDAETTCVLLGVSSAIAVAVVTSTLVDVSSVVSVQVSVVNDVSTFVSVVIQLVLTVTDTVTAGEGLGNVPENTVTFPVGKDGLPEREPEAISAPCSPIGLIASLEN